MSFKICGARRDHSHDPGSIAEHGTHGGLFATVLSAVALVFSGLSYYDNSLASADLTVYVPPMVHYARDGADVFNIPITLANDGARAGTVLSMELEVENLQADAERKSVRFRSAFLGDYPRDDKAPLRSFAPISVPGHGTVTETVRFYNMGEMLPMLVTDKGDFRFTLTLNMAKPQSGLFESLTHTAPKPLTFELNMPYFAVQHVSFQNGTIAMFNKDWKPAISTSTEPAVSRKVEKAADTGDDAPAKEAAPETTPEIQAPRPAPETKAPETKAPEQNTGSDAQPQSKPQAKPAPPQQKR
ncbi:MAG: hypothetical protein ABL907_03630 [Hyphomicrobium sp.]